MRAVTPIGGDTSSGVGAYIPEIMTRVRWLQMKLLSPRGAGIIGANRSGDAQEMGKR